MAGVVITALLAVVWSVLPSPRGADALARRVLRIPTVPVEEGSASPARPAGSTAADTETTMRKTILGAAIATGSFGFQQFDFGR